MRVPREQANEIGGAVDEGPKLAALLPVRDNHLQYVSMLYYIYIYIYIIYIYISIYIYIFIYIDMYVYIYLYIHTQTHTYRYL